MKNNIPFSTQRRVVILCLGKSKKRYLIGSPMTNALTYFTMPNALGKLPFESCIVSKQLHSNPLWRQTKPGLSVVPQINESVFAG